MVKIPESFFFFFVVFDKPIFKFIWKFKEWKVIKTISKLEDLTVPDLKTYSKDKIIKIMWYWHKDGHRKQ